MHKISPQQVCQQNCERTERCVYMVGLNQKSHQTLSSCIQRSDRRAVPGSPSPLLILQRFCTPCNMTAWMQNMMSELIQKPQSQRKRKCLGQNSGISKINGNTPTLFRSAGILPFAYRKVSGYAIV